MTRATSLSSERRFLVALALRLWLATAVALAPMSSYARTSTERVSALKTDLRELKRVARTRAPWSTGHQFENEIFLTTLANLNTRQEIFSATKAVKSDPKALDAEAARRLKILDETKESIAQRAFSGAGQSLGGAAHEVGQTYLMIFLMSAIEIVKKEYEESRQDYRSMSPEKMTESLGNATGYMLNATEIWTSILTAGISHVATKKVIEVFSFIISSTSLNALFKAILQSLASSAITFVGWDFGAQLINEASTLARLEATDKETAELAGDMNRLWTNIYHMSAGKLGATDPEAVRSTKALALLSKNLTRIIVNDPDLRAQWVYNALRERITKGPFITLIVSMSTVGAAGTTVFPGAGTLGGLAFGLAGGLVATFIPDTSKDGISHFVDDGWLTTLKKMDGNGAMSKLRALYDDKGDPLSVQQSAKLADKVTKFFGMKAEAATPTPPLQDVLMDRESYRQYVVDVHMERIYLAQAQHDKLVADLVQLNQKLQAANTADWKSRLQSDIQDVTRDIALYARWLQNAEKDLIVFYVQEAHLFSALSMEKYKDGDINETISDEMRNAENMLSFFCTFTRNLQLVNTVSLPDATWADNESSMSISCKTHQPTTRSYEGLNDSEKGLYDGALQFVRRVHMKSFNEAEASVQRLKATIQYEENPKPQAIPKF